MEMKEFNEKQDKLLALCDLEQGDFVRFRGAYIEDGKLIVETRENGVGERSSDAIKNPNYISSEPDEGDSTYEYYYFNIPKDKRLWWCCSAPYGEHDDNCPNKGS